MSAWRTLQFGMETNPLDLTARGGFNEFQPLASHRSRRGGACTEDCPACKADGNSHTAPKEKKGGGGDAALSLQQASCSARIRKDYQKIMLKKIYKNSKLKICNFTPSGHLWDSSLLVRVNDDTTRRHNFGSDETRECCECSAPPLESKLPRWECPRLPR